MSFLAPLFLLGLAALAVPVLIHLIQRERKNVVQFPSLMFLQRIPYQSVRRRRIRNWPLLLLRLAALALIVAAFARPFLRRRRAGRGGGRRRPRGGGAARPVVQHGLRRSVDAGDRRRRGTRSPGWSRPIARRSCSSRRARRSRCARQPTAAGCAAVDAGKPGAGATRYGPGAEAGRQHAERVGAAAPRSDPDLAISSAPAGRAPKACGCPTARR